MLKNVLSSVAAASLVVAPVAAQANTRAASAGVSMSELAAVERAPAAIGDFERQGLENDQDLLYWLLGFLAASAAIVALVETSENDSSSGTGG